MPRRTSLAILIAGLIVLSAGIIVRLTNPPCSREAYIGVLVQAGIEGRNVSDVAKETGISGRQWAATAGNYASDPAVVAEITQTLHTQALVSRPGVFPP